MKEQGITYKIVFLDNKNPDLLYSKLFYTEGQLMDYAKSIQVDEFLVSKLVKQEGDRYIWQIDQEFGAGKNFIKGYKFYQAMKTKESQVAYYLLGLAGGVLTFVIVKKVASNNYVAGVSGILGAFLTQYIATRVKTA